MEGKKKGLNLLDGPAGDAPLIPQSSVCVHADDPHRHLHRCRPRDSRGTAAAPKQTTPHSTISRSRIQSARFSALIWSACICAPANSHTTIVVVGTWDRSTRSFFFSPRRRGKSAKTNVGRFCKIVRGWLCVYVCMCAYVRVDACVRGTYIGSDRVVRARRFVVDSKCAIDPLTSGSREIRLKTRSPMIAKPRWNPRDDRWRIHFYASSRFIDEERTTTEI